MSSQTADTTYLIKTKNGNKGPFSRRQICKLVIKKQLPENVNVRDTQTDKSVLVADIVSGKAYQNVFEDEALSIASDLIEEVIFDAQDSYSSPVSSSDDNATEATKHRRTQSQKRRNTSSRGFDSEIVESVQRSSRSSRNSRQSQQMKIAGAIVGFCVILGLILLLMPSQNIQGIWAQGNQVLTISQSVIKLQEDDKDLINAYYKTLDSGALSTTWFLSGKTVVISVELSGDTLITVFDGEDTKVWQRRR